MTVDEIISLVSNPGTIENGLAEAENIHFTDEDRSLFEIKRNRYAAGMSDYEKLNWIQEMSVFLRKYMDRYGNYQSDPMARWHYLDKQKLKKKFNELRRSPGKLKVVFIEHDHDPLSFQLHEILYSFYHAGVEDQSSLRQPFSEQTVNPSGKIKGYINDFDIYLDQGDRDELEAQWSEFMKSVFGISETGSVVDYFNNKNLGNETHFVVQSIHDFNADNFETYFAFWNVLILDKPLFLFFYISPSDWSKIPDRQDFLQCSINLHRFVQGMDFTRFFACFKNCYKEDLTLCRCDQMTFREALERLQFCELYH